MLGIEEYNHSFHYAFITLFYYFSDESSCINAEDGSGRGGNQVVIYYPKGSVPC